MCPLKALNSWFSLAFLIIEETLINWGCAKDHKDDPRFTLSFLLISKSCILKSSGIKGIEYAHFEGKKPLKHL